MLNSGSHALQMPFGAFGYRLCNGSERLFSASASLSSEFLEPGIFGYPYLFCICHYCIESTKVESLSAMQMASHTVRVAVVNKDIPFFFILLRM